MEQKKAGKLAGVRPAVLAAATVILVGVTGAGLGAAAAVPSHVPAASELVQTTDAVGNSPLTATPAPLTASPACCQRGGLDPTQGAISGS